MGYGTAKLFLRHRLMGHGLDDVRTGHKHVGRVFDHEDEIGHGRRVDRAAGARSHNQRDLRHDTGRQNITLEYLGITAKRRDTFLDAGTAGIIQTDDRRADLERLIHDPADLLGMGFGKRAAEHREILAEHENKATIDRAIAGDHTVAGDLLIGHAEIGAAMLNEHAPLFERAFVQKHFETLARCEFAFGVLGRNALGPAAHLGSLPIPLQLKKCLLHVSPPCCGRV